MNRQGAKMNHRAGLTLIGAFLLGSCSLVAGPASTPSVPGGPGTPAGERTEPRAGPEERPPLPGHRPPATWLDAPPPLEREPLPVPPHVRALWVVRTTLAHPDSVRLMVRRAAAAGFNVLLVQVRGRGDAYYLSRWEPRPPGVADLGVTFDPLGLVIQEAHARGLAVHAWVNAHLVGGIGGLPPDARHLIRARPDLLAVPHELARELYDVPPDEPRFAEALLHHAQENRARVEGIYTAPSHPEVKEHLYSVWMDLVDSYDLDGLHFDYIRYPNADFDYSRGAIERFHRWAAPLLPPGDREALESIFQSDPVGFAEALPALWDDFRRAQITDLVERIYYGVKKRRPALAVSAAVFPDPKDAAEHRFQDWGGWVRAGILDAVVPMAYTPEDSLFRSQIESAVEQAGADRVWAGIGAYQNSFEGAVSKARIARRLGIRGFSLFSYDWAVAEGASIAGGDYLERFGREARAIGW